MRRKLLGLAALAALTGIGLPSTGQAQSDPPYQVKDGKVDKATYNGYRRFGNACERCHGQGGAGSSFAPSLIESLKKLSYDDFTETVINGRKNLADGQNKVMPSFGTNEDVVTYMDDIYGYLKARSDGALKGGRPERFDR